MREELAAIRHGQEQLQDRVDRLEARAKAPEAVGRRPSAPAVRAADPLAGLPVVRLAPPSNPAAAAPRLDTRIELREPSDDDLAALDRAPVNGDAVLDRRDAQADQLFAASVRRYNAGERKEAGEELAAFAEQHPRHDAADNALYLAGMAQVASGRCADGAHFFESVVQAYPDGDAVAPSLLALGLCASGLGHLDKARGYFEQVLKESPGSAEASQADAELGDLSRKKPVAGRP